MHVPPLRKHFANRHLHSPESKTAKIFHLFCMHDKNKNKYQQQQQKQTKNQRNKVVYFFFLSFLLQILFINRCVRHKSESCHSRDMVGEPLLFFFSSLLAVVVVVRLLVTIAAHCRERLRHTHTTGCEYGPRLGRQRARERAMAASVSSIFFTFDVVNAACSSPHLLLCSPYFVSSAKLIAKSIFYLATFERGAYLASLSRACTCNWRCWHIAFGMPDVSKYGRCCSLLSSALFSFIYSCIAFAPLSGGLALASASLIVSSITCRDCLCCRDL